MKAGRSQELEPCIQSRLKSSRKHHSSLPMAEMESQNDRARKALKRPHSTTHRWTGTCLYSQAEHKELQCPFQAWGLTFKKAVDFMFCFLWQMQSSDWTLSPHTVNIWTGFQHWSYYFGSHSCSTLNSGAWLTQRLIRCCPHHSTQPSTWFSWHRPVFVSWLHKRPG